jgi:hypothetical protein
VHVEPLSSESGQDADILVEVQKLAKH